VLLEASTLLSSTGNGITTVALPWLVLERTGSPTATGVVAAATALPLLAGSLLAGMLVDTLGRRRVAWLADAASALSAAAIPLIDATGGLTVPVLVALAVLGALFDPAGLTARETLLPAAADAAQWRLIRVNGVHEAVFGLAYLVGPGIGGVLIAAVGAPGTMWASAAAFAVSVGLVACVRVPGAGRPRRRPRRVWRATGEGLRFVWRDRLLRTLALLNVAIAALYLPVEGVILPAQFVAEATPERLGLVVMAMSAGGLAGALLFGTVGHRLHRRAAFITAVLGSSTVLLAMATLPRFPVLVALAAVVGLLYGPVAPLVNTAMQIRTPERLRGPVVGVVTSVAYAAGPAGYLVAGPLTEAFGPRSAFLAMASTLLAVVLVVMPTRALRELDAPEPSPAAPVRPVPVPGFPPGTPPPEGTVEDA
jgi:MFS family permease